MPTRSVIRTESARDTQTQKQHYLYKRVTFATPNVQSTPGKIVYVGVLPAESLKQETIVRINTTFDGTMIIGTSLNTAAFGSSADILSGGPADTYVVNTGYGARSTLDVPVYVQLTTGTTVGEADIWLTYLLAR